MLASGSAPSIFLRAGLMAGTPDFIVLGVTAEATAGEAVGELAGAGELTTATGGAAFMGATGCALTTTDVDLTGALSAIAGTATNSETVSSRDDKVRLILFFL